MASGEILVAHGMWEVLKNSRAYVNHSVGVYGASETGKTTLDRQLTTQGEVRPLGEKDRTHHTKKRSGKYVMPEPTAKRIRSHGLRRTIVSRDLGGHTEYHSTWLRDMWTRKVRTIVVVIDHRHMVDPSNTDNQVALSYLVQSLRQGKKPKGRGIWKTLFQRKYSPRRIIILANKADIWLNDEESFDLWRRGAIIRHPLFDSFRETIYEIQEANIPLKVDAVSAAIGWNVDEALFRGLMDL